MNVCDIIDIIKSIKDKDILFLIEPLSEHAGFFSFNGHLLYVVKDVFGYSYEGIETDYLRLETHIYISSVENNQTFIDDYYNIIIFKGELTDENIDSFIKLCRLYVWNMDEVRFKEFFYSLISLFQLPSEQNYKNAIGLYGELKFMQMAVETFEHDISNAWHKKGTTSQYDFTNGDKNIEVKTTTTEEMSICIKQKQIFGENLCWLVTVVCKEDENGETIEELINRLIDKKGVFNSIYFSINLAKELKRISPKEARDLRLKLQEIRVFDTKEINPFPSIPDIVDKLEYRLDVTEMNSLAQNDIAQLIFEF